MVSQFDDSDHAELAKMLTSKMSPKGDGRPQRTSDEEETKIRLWKARALNKVHFSVTDHLRRVSTRADVRVDEKLT